MLRGLSDFRNLVIYCQMHVLVRDVNGNRCLRLGNDASYGSRIEYHNGMRITIKRHFYLFSAPAGVKHTDQELFDALQAIDGVICPHLRTSSSHLLHRTELTAECSVGLRYYSFDRRKLENCKILWTHYFMDRELCISWSKCPNQECDTWFGLRQISHVGYPIRHVVLDVRRGFVGDPKHPSWKAQVVSREQREGINAATVASVPRTTGCTSQGGSCKGPVCAARHPGLVMTPHDSEGAPHI
jgi:hypothetical protein